MRFIYTAPCADSVTVQHHHIIRTMITDVDQAQKTGQVKGVTLTSREREDSAICRMVARLRTYMYMYMRYNITLSVGCVVDCTNVVIVGSVDMSSVNITKKINLIFWILTREVA